MTGPRWNLRFQEGHAAYFAKIDRSFRHPVTTFPQAKERRGARASRAPRSRSSAIARRAGQGLESARISAKPTLDAPEHDGSQDEVITRRETGDHAGEIADQVSAKQVINLERNSQGTSARSSWPPQQGNPSR
jgi:hypothetical protein